MHFYHRTLGSSRRAFNNASRQGTILFHSIGESFLGRSIVFVPPSGRGGKAAGVAASGTAATAKVWMAPSFNLLGTAGVRSGQAPLWRKAGPRGAAAPTPTATAETLAIAAKWPRGREGAWQAWRGARRGNRGAES